MLSELLKRIYVMLLAVSNHPGIEDDMQDEAENLAEELADEFEKGEDNDRS